MSLSFDGNKIVYAEGSINIEPLLTFYGQQNIDCVNGLLKRIQELEAQLLLEQCQKAKLREHFENLLNKK